jgi:cell pole-organizing protein PopZ
MTSNELPGLEEMAAEIRGLEEMAAALARARPQATNADEPSQKDATVTEHLNVESGPVEPAVAAPPLMRLFECQCGERSWTEEKA